MLIAKGAGILEGPYVVCHMLTALDGKIDGDFMSDPACAPYRELFGQLRVFHQCDATLYGTVTMQESYADGIVEKLPTSLRKYPRQDYIAQSDVENYIVSVDTAGVLAWKGKYIEKKGRPKAHVIEVLTQQVSDDYLAYLRSFDISYIFAGYGELDCQLLLKKLVDLFGIRRLMISGGGFMNWTFLQENLIDELSLILAPLADGNSSTVTLFKKMPFLTPRAPVVFQLKEVKVIGEDGLWIRYAVKK